MNNSTLEGLSGFASSVNSLIPVSSILVVLGIALGSAFSIYLVVWGARMIIRSIKGGINGRLDTFSSSSNSFMNPYDDDDYSDWDDYLAWLDRDDQRNNSYEHYFDNMSSYTDYYDEEDRYDAISYGYNSARDYYYDKLIAHNSTSSDDLSQIKNAKYRRWNEDFFEQASSSYNDIDDDDYERYEVTHPHLSHYDRQQIRDEYPDGYDDLPF